MTYYKGVKVENEKLVSAFVTQKNAVIEYKIGEWVKPQIKHSDYGIFVSLDKNALDTISLMKRVDSDGRLYNREGDAFEIYECEVILAKKVLMPKMYYGFTIIPKKDTEGHFVDSNTLIVKKCKLTRKLSKNEVKKFVVS